MGDSRFGKDDTAVADRGPAAHREPVTGRRFGEETGYADLFLALLLPWASKPAHPAPCGMSSQLADLAMITGTSAACRTA
ncbi:hypothetical protein ABZ552_13310 [Nocardia sp. NPDC019219]|uniref:hypothetical protein n=1 Tax=Nocardia TaxID=1817 RepID=UPI002490AFF1|nr:hypothetical protein [Nocardia sputorum]